jgi:hypothetical protein
VKYINSIAFWAQKKVWRREALVLAFITIFFVAIFGVFSKVPEGASVQELTSAESASSLRVIFENPVNAPYKLLTLVTTTISPTIRAARLASFIYLIAASYGLFYVLKHWHKTQTAALVSAAFATNSIVLAVGRLGTPLITVLSWFVFTGMLLWQLHSRSNKLLPVIVLTALSGLLYTPGVLWFFIIIAIVYWNRFKKLFKQAKLQAVLIGILIALVIATPLILGFIRDPNSLKAWLLLPQELIWSEVWRSALAVPSAFIYRMPLEPLVNINRLPVFDVASGVLFLIGLNAYRRKLRLDRTRMMIGSAIVGITLGALGQTLTAVVLLLPFAYSVIAAGIEFLLDQWNRIFPRNPFARSFGLILVTVAITFSAYYHLTRFLVVWPQTPETRATYNNSRIID